MIDITQYSDDDFPDGVYAIPRPQEPCVKICALNDYCKAKGRKQQDLSEEKISLFLVYDNGL